MLRDPSGSEVLGSKVDPWRISGGSEVDPRWIGGGSEVDHLCSFYRGCPTPSLINQANGV